MEAETPGLSSHLISEMALGRVDALEQLYASSASYLKSVALRITRNPALAEEATVAALWQAWQQSHRFDPARGSVTSWLQCIVRSRALDAVRRVNESVPHPDPHRLAGGESDWSCDPQAMMLQAERIEQLRNAIDTLRPEQKQLLALAFYKGLTHEQIARQSDLPLGTVKSHIRRGIASLRGALDADALHAPYRRNGVEGRGFRGGAPKANPGH
jgi:RNA polymerase sigma-70 factor (ECF subfamily)